MVQKLDLKAPLSLKLSLIQKEIEINTESALSKIKADYGGTKEEDLDLKNKSFSSKVKSLRNRHFVYHNYLSNNIWTLTHPEDALKRDFVNAKAPVFSIINEIFWGKFLISALEWQGDTGIGDLVLFNGLNVFLVVELKMEHNEFVKSQALRYKEDWEKEHGGFSVYASVYTPKTFSISFNESWVDFPLESIGMGQHNKSDNLGEKSGIERADDLESLVDFFSASPFQTLRSCDFGEVAMEETKMRHAVFGQFLAANRWFLTPSAALKRHFCDFQSDLHRHYEGKGFVYIWALDLRVRVGESFVVCDLVLANANGTLYFVFIGTIKSRNESVSKAAGALVQKYPKSEYALFDGDTLVGRNNRNGGFSEILIEKQH